MAGCLFFFFFGLFMALLLRFFFIGVLWVRIWWATAFSRINSLIFICVSFQNIFQGSKNTLEESSINHCQFAIRRCHYGSGTYLIFNERKFSKVLTRLIVGKDLLRCRFFMTWVMMFSTVFHLFGCYGCPLNENVKGITFFTFLNYELTRSKSCFFNTVCNFGSFVIGHAFEKFYFW